MFFFLFLWWHYKECDLNSDYGLQSNWIVVKPKVQPATKISAKIKMSQIMSVSWKLHDALYLTFRVSSLEFHSDAILQWQMCMFYVYQKKKKAKTLPL